MCHRFSVLRPFLPCHSGCDTPESSLSNWFIHWKLTHRPTTRRKSSYWPSLPIEPAKPCPQLRLLLLVFYLQCLPQQSWLLWKELRFCYRQVFLLLHIVIRSLYCWTQVQGQGGSETRYKGVFDIMGHLYKEGGLRSIFRGSGATLARDGPGSAA